jgi:hypothetical protein
LRRAKEKIIMRFVTPVALALVLAVTSGAVSAPAFAAKKEKEQAPAGGPNPKNLSSGFQAAIVKAQEAEKKKDIEGQKAAIAEAEPLATNPDEKFFLYSQKVNLSISTQDAKLQGEAITGMLDTGLVTDPKQLGQFNSIAAKSALEQKNYDLALQRAQAAQAAGWSAADVQPTLAQIYFGKAGANPSVEPGRGFTQQGLAALKAGADAIKASGQTVPANWYEIGVSRAETAKLPEVTEWAKMAYVADPSGKNLRTLIRLFQRANPNISTRENLDVFRLMSASGGLVIAADYVEYAEMAGRALSYGEVKSTIEAGRAKNVLNASQGGEAYQTAMAKIPSDKSSLPAAEADARKGSGTGKAIAGTADAFLGYGDYAKAIELFGLALQKGGVDADEVNTRLGIAKALSGDNAGAKAAFGAVAGGARKEIAGLWIAYLDSKAA